MYEPLDSGQRGLSDNFVRSELELHAELREVRHDASGMGFLTLAAVVLMNVVVISVIPVLLQVPAFLSYVPQYANLHPILYYAVSCLAYLVGIGGPPLLYLLLKKRPLESAFPFDAPKKHGLTVFTLLCLFFVGIALSLFANYPTSWISSFLETMGMPVPETPDMPLTMDAASQIFYVIYSVLIPPLVEEFLFRGVVIGTLKKYGNWFAILLSAIFFGLYHGNVQQFIFATLVGLVLGYLRVRTGSILLPLLVHAFNNGLSVAIDLISQQFGEDAAISFSVGYFLLFFVLGAVALVYLLIKHRKNLAFPKESLPRCRASFSLRVSTGYLSAGSLVLTAATIFLYFVSL